MKVKFKDGNIVDAIRYTTEVYESGELVRFITSLIRKSYPSADDILFTEMHDRAIDITWSIKNGSAKLILQPNDWCYQNPKDNGVWCLRGDLFADQYLEKMPDEESKTNTIQEDIKSLETKISVHLQEIGAVSVTFKIAGQPVVFEHDRNKDTFEFTWDGQFAPGPMQVKASADELIEKFKKEPWKFTQAKGGHRG